MDAGLLLDTGAGRVLLDVCLLLPLNSEGEPLNSELLPNIGTGRLLLDAGLLLSDAGGLLLRRGAGH